MNNKISIAVLELVDFAKTYIIERGIRNRHHIACAAETVDGRRLVSLHVSSNLGAGSVCAEAVLIAEFLKDHRGDIRYLVAVRNEFNDRHDTAIVSPCGRCRELILEYAPECEIIVDGKLGLFTMKPAELLPNPYERRRI